MNIGKSVKIVLAQKEMEPKELAEALEVTTATINNLVKSTSCTGPMLERLISVFEMKGSELIALGE